MGTDGLEDVLDRDVHVVDPAWEDRSGVDEGVGNIESDGGHHHAREGLVAPGQRDDPVEAFRVHHRLDGVGDHLAAHQRGPHALVSHRDAVGHRDRRELDREAAGLTDARLGVLCEACEWHVARRDLVP